MATETKGAVCNIAETIQMLRFALNADVVLHLEGDPGIGKSAIVRALASEMGVPLHTLILSQCAPEDVGGVPVKDGNAISRLPIGPIRRCCEAPGILFGDEYSQAPAHIQGASLTLINERFAGDAQLHPGTRIVLASNPVESGSGANDLTPPATNRMHHIRVIPDVSEVQAYFSTLGTEGSTLRSLAVDYMATVDNEPRLIALSPPPGAAASGLPWASPRAIERALRLFAAALDAGESDMGKTAIACLSGSLGEDAARAYMAIRKVRDRLPSVKQILTDPTSAILPTDSGTRVASLGILAQVAQVDPCAAWAYVGRFNGTDDREVRTVAGKQLMRFNIEEHAKKSAHYKVAKEARIKTFGMIGATQGRIS